MNDIIVKTNNGYIVFKDEKMLVAEINVFETTSSLASFLGISISALEENLEELKDIHNLKLH